MRLLSKLCALFRKGKLDAGMSEEMRTHLELQTAQNISRGMKADEARYAAQREFGGVEQIKERARDARGGVWLEQLGKDVGYAWRQVRRAPGFAAIAVLTFALGIGLVTVQFSFVRGVAFTGPRFEGAERVVTLTTAKREGGEAVTSLRHFLELRSAQTSFEQIAAFKRGGVVLSGEGVLARPHIGVDAAAEVFAIARAQPLLGRTLRVDDNAPGAPRVAVLGWQVWQADFGGDVAVVGRVVRVNGEPATIVGVMPAGFEFPIAEEVWTNLPLPAAATAASWLDRVQIVARLRPDASLARAQAEMETIVARATVDAPKRGPIGVHAVLVPFAQGELGRPFLVIVWTLFLIAALVLVLACVNIANLLYARAVRQRHELAVRTALGASRGRLVRQMLGLSLMLAGMGAAAGVVVAAWAAPLMNVLLTDPRKPYWIKVATDWPVVAAVAALTVAVGVMAGLMPALRSSRLRPNTVLRDGGGAGQLALGRAGRGLSLVQIALAATVLTVGTVLWRGVLHLARENYPPEVDRVLAASRLSAPPEQAGTSSPEATRRLLPDLLERAGALPGVERVAATGRGWTTPLVVEGANAAENAKAGQFPSLAVSADYFSVFDVKALRGRVFAPSDFAPGAAPVVAVNESAARRYWPDADPVGRRVRYENTEGLGDWHTVVGVVPDLPLPRRSWELHAPGLYSPLDLAVPADATLLVRVAGDPAALALPVRRVLHELAPDRVFHLGVQPLTAAIDSQLQILRLLSGLAAVFGGCGVLLAALGIFGVQAFFVESRRREFGVRLALGARPAQLLALVFQHGAWQLALGAPLGLAGGWALVRVLRGTTLLSPVAEIDAAACAIAASVLLAAVFLACWLPARRAAKVDPMVALRCE